MAGAIRAKICGIKDSAAMSAAVGGGAAYIGLVFFAKSPRNVSHAVARDLAGQVPPGVCKVALTVNMADAELQALLSDVPLDMLQLHGNESPERVAEVKALSGLPVMKAIGISDPSDLAAIEAYSAVADQLLIDAKPPKGAPLPGGNGIAFDWRLLAGRRWACPWMLAGGLTPANVAEAAARTGAAQVDVSTGVERGPGVKDPDLIEAFLETLKQPALQS